MKRSLLVLAVIIAFAQGSSVAAQDEAQATIEALQTQVAELSATESPVVASPVALTADEAAYLTTVAETLETLVQGRQQMAFYRDYPPDFDDPNFLLAISIGTLGFLFARDSKVESAPSERLQPFNQQWNETIDSFVAAADAFMPTDGQRMNQQLFDAAFTSLGEASDQLDGALQTLVDLGLYTTVYRFTHPQAAPGTENIVGSITLTDSDAPWSTPICAGDGGYSDLARESQVVIRDESGDVIATGEITRTLTRSPTECELTFYVYNVPPAEFYQVSIGGRDAPTYTFDEMEQQQWTLSLSIGD